MTPLVPIALYCWPAVVLILCREFKSYRGVAISFVMGSLFLPCTGMQFMELPYSKETVTGFSTLIATVLFYPKMLLRFRFRWFDAPIMVFCFSPIASAFANELPIAHGIRLAFNQVCVWGIPYFVGRIHFNSFRAVKYLAKTIFIGGLIYVPFCLFELRMSPQLHKSVYGFYPGNWSVIRWGGYRPSVFLEQGLSLGLWMTFASLMGFMLWRTKSPKRIFGVKLAYCWIVVLLVTLFCKSTGALLLLIAGIVAGFFFRSYRSALPVFLLAAISVVYIGVRSAALDNGSILVDFSHKYISEARAASLGFRLKMEDLLIEKAMESPWFGWSGMGRNRLYDENGKAITIADGFWIITLGNYGFLALVSVYLAFTLPPVALALRFRRKKWNQNDVGPVVAIGIFLLLFLIDSLMNAMPLDVYPLALGAISTIFGMTRTELEPELQGIEESVAVDVDQRQLWPPRPLKQPVMT